MQKLKGLWIPAEDFRLSMCLLIRLKERGYMK